MILKPKKRDETMLTKTSNNNIKFTVSETLKETTNVSKDEEYTNMAKCDNSEVYSDVERTLNYTRLNIDKQVSPGKARTQYFLLFRK